MATMPTEQGGHEEHTDAVHAHNPFLHHHFDSPWQQFESDKMGMWLFLATEVLLFGGLFCAYSVYRGNHPEIFHYAHRYLNKTYGGINTIVLIFSSFTMAWAVKATQEGKRALAQLLMLITILCAFTFMGIKYIEYTSKIREGLLWGTHYHPKGEALTKFAAPEAPAAAIPGGMPAAAPGRAALSGGSEPQAAGTPLPLQHSAGTAAGATQAPVGAKPAIATPTSAALAQPPASTVASPGVLAATPPKYSYAASLKLEPTKIPPAVRGPEGLSDTASIAATQPQQSAPQNVQTFFAIYFVMTGLHGIHVLVGIIVIFIMMRLNAQGKFGPQYFTPVDLTGLYWHIVDLIWIFLFPLFYLIS